MADENQQESQPAPKERKLMRHMPLLTKVLEVVSSYVIHCVCQFTIKVAPTFTDTLRFCTLLFTGFGRVRDRFGRRSAKLVPEDLDQDAFQTGRRCDHLHHCRRFPDNQHAVHHLPADGRSNTEEDGESCLF